MAPTAHIVLLHMLVYATASTTLSAMTPTSATAALTAVAETAAIVAAAPAPTATATIATSKRPSRPFCSYFQECNRGTVHEDVHSGRGQM